MPKRVSTPLLIFTSVQHSEVLHPMLTVHETLYYTAMLRLPRAMSKQDKLSRVDAMLLTLGLEACKDAMVGSSGGLGGEKGATLSGGERKRVSIAIEVVLKPNAILLGAVAFLS